VNIAFEDQANGKNVPSPFAVATLNDASGTLTVVAPAAVGVTFRKVLITWTADGGGSTTASAYVNCCKPPKTPPPTTTPTGTTQTVTVTTPGQTTTTPGQTVTVTTPGQTVTTPGQTTTVTTPGATVTVTVPGQTTTVTTPGATRIVVRHKTKTKVVVRYRKAVIVHCPPGYSGSASVPIGNTKGKPIVTRCVKRTHVKGVGVTG
jgi:hypothetical protein